MSHPCPICAEQADLLDVVDLNKNCDEHRGTYLPIAGVPIYYALCNGCGFCFSPAMCEWPREKFASLIYNDDYILVDPDYVTVRPQGNADSLLGKFADLAKGIRHLDYGGGYGLLSDLLGDAGWNSTSFDPFVNDDTDFAALGKFDLITAFEVFEHVPDPQALMRNLSDLITDDGMLLFSTMLSDGEIAPRKRLTWWYASPRNGHISLYASSSLKRLTGDFGFKLHSYSLNFHACWRTRPAWGEHLLPPQQ